MADAEDLRRSPLSHLEGVISAAAVSGERAVSLREVPFVSMLSIRVELASAASREIEAGLGGALPRACGNVGGSSSNCAIWLGPDEWLVVSESETSLLAAKLSSALAAGSGSVLDVSANRTILQLAGPSARSVLEKGCPVDLHPRAFQPVSAVSTTLGPVPVILWQTGAETYRLLPRSSFADYVARWLIDAMAEYASPVVP